MNKFCPVCCEEVQTDSANCPDCNCDLVDLKEDSLVGQILDDRYTITKELGRGGMGVVYVAKQKYLDREVAIKVLRSEMSQDGSNIKRFMLEAKAASGLASPHTVTIHDFGVTAEGLMYFVMEKMKGEGLAELVEKVGALPTERAVEIVVQTCVSLAEAHEHKIWHRDIKPDNIFVTEGESGKDHVKVLDFGIAKLGSATTNITAAGMICGTPAYLSPEQAQGVDVDGRTDIYSLGVVLYELLAGEPPFVSETPIKVLLCHVHEEPPALDVKNPNVNIPAALNDVLKHAMHKDRDKRIKSAEEFARLLRSAMQSHRADPEEVKLPGLASGVDGVRSVLPEGISASATVAAPAAPTAPEGPSAKGPAATEVFEEPAAPEPVAPSPSVPEPVAPPPAVAPSPSVPAQELPAQITWTEADAAKLTGKRSPWLFVSVTLFASLFTGILLIWQPWSGKSTGEKKDEKQSVSATAAEEKKAAEAARKMDEEKAAVAARKVDEERAEAEAAVKKAQEEKAEAEAARKAVEDKVAADEAKRSQEAAMAEAVKKAKEETLAEAARKAAEEKALAEAAKKAEEKAAAEAAKLAAEKKAAEKKTGGKKDGTKKDGTKKDGDYVIMGGGSSKKKKKDKKKKDKKKDDGYIKIP